MTKEEAQKLVFEELKKRISEKDFMKNFATLSGIQTNARLMQQIMEEHPEWGYKIIINSMGYFVLIPIQ